MGLVTLTLTQVKAAGRFAWKHDSRIAWLPGTGLIVVSVDDCRDFTEDSFAEAVTWSGAEEYLQTAWHHLPGCDCEFCHE